MKLLFDFFPIVLFFIAYKLYGIYVATGVAMVASVVQIGYFWLRHRRVESLHVITMVLVIVLGSATLLFHNDLFIKWKPTAIYWAFAAAFWVSQWVGVKKPLIQRLMDNKLQLLPLVWQRLNWSWVIFFVSMGLINIFVLYNFSTNTWVNFKLFGTLALTLLFVIGQAFYMARHTDDMGKLKEKNKNVSL